MWPPSSRSESIPAGDSPALMTIVEVEVEDVVAATG